MTKKDTQEFFKQLSESKEYGGISLVSGEERILLLKEISNKIDDFIKDNLERMHIKTSLDVITSQDLSFDRMSGIKFARNYLTSIFNQAEEYIPEWYKVEGKGYMKISGANKIIQ